MGMVSQTASAQSVWRMGYVEDPTTPSATTFPYTYFTHLIMIGFNCNGSGALYNQFGYPVNLWPGFRSGATANGVKLVLFIGGDMTTCTNNTNLSSYVTKIVNTVKGTDTSLNTAGVVFDGVSLDWESGLTSASITPYENLISSLRAGLGPTKTINFDGWNDSIFRSIAVNQNSNLDRFNNEMYDGAVNGGGNNSCQGWSWYNLAVHSLDSNCDNAADIGFTNMVNAGFPASKINEGIPYYGYLYTGCNHAEVLGCTASLTQYSYATIKSNPTFQAGQHLNDSRQLSDYIVLGTNQYLTYTDTLGISQLVNWGKSVGLGGYFVWTTNRDYISGGTTQAEKSPLSFALFTDVTGGSSAPNPPTGLTATVQ
jgi:Glycosyl hydrolases family 18